MGRGGAHTNDIFEKIKSSGIIADIRTERPAQAVHLAKAVQAGGLSVCITDCGNSVVEIRREVEGMLIGVFWTERSEPIDTAINSGANFLMVSSFDQTLVQCCTAKNIPLVPCASNLKDLERISGLGLSVAAVFPQEGDAVPEFLREAGEKFPSLRFIPIGVEQEDRLEEYLLLPEVIACVYSRIGTTELAGEPSLATEYAKSAINRMLGFEIGHVGINFDDDVEAQKTATCLSEIFGLPLYAGEPSYFVGTIFECVKAPYWGCNGHVAIRTNHIERAVEYLCARGIKFNENSKQYDSSGRMRTIYFADDIADFVMHLLQK